MARKTLRAKLDDKVKVRSKNECWPWAGAVLPYGYGVISHNGKMLSAHRVAYKLKHGKLPMTKKVLRSCLNSLCCNPRHMFLGSLADAHRLLGIQNRRRDLRRGKRYLTTRQKKSGRC